MNINKALVVHVAPVEQNSFRYRFRIENVSALEVRSISFDFTWVLGPEDFGWHERNMPRCDPQNFSVPSLAPGESVSVELQKSGSLASFRGDLSSLTTRGRFADGSPLNGHTLNHYVRVRLDTESS